MAPIASPTLSAVPASIPAPWRRRGSRPRSASRPRRGSRRPCRLTRLGGERAQEAGDVLGVAASRRPDGRPRAAAASAPRPAPRPAAGLWPPSSQSSPRRRRLDQRAAAQALQPRRPVGAGDGRLAGRLVRAELAQARQRGAGVVDLMRADQVRAAAGRASPASSRRPAGRAPPRPASPGRRRCSGAPTRCGPRLDHARGASAACGPTTQGTPRFRMPAFSPAISASVSPRYCWWSIETGVMTVSRGRVDDVGRVEPAAEADLEQRRSRPASRPRREGRRRW